LVANALHLGKRRREFLEVPEKMLDFWKVSELLGADHYLGIKTAVTKIHGRDSCFALVDSSGFYLAVLQKKRAHVEVESTVGVDCGTASQGSRPAAGLENPLHLFVRRLMVNHKGA
jgi:hypothetical protein